MRQQLLKSNLQSNLVFFLLVIQNQRYLPLNTFIEKRSVEPDGMKLFLLSFQMKTAQHLVFFC